MVAPKPITLTQRAAIAGEETPQPFVVVGTIPADAAVQALTAIATADATDLATAITLANATKAKVNQIITAIQ